MNNNGKWIKQSNLFDMKIFLSKYHTQGASEQQYISAEKGAMQRANI